MSHIPPIDQVLRSLRAQPLLESTASQAADKSNGSGAQFKSSRQWSAEAAKHIVLQIGAIAKEDPQRRRRAFRAFLEGRLIGMMGKDALHSRAFRDLLDQVHDTMSTNKDMVRAMDGVADFLLANRTTPAILDKLAEAFQTPSGARTDTSVSG